MTQEEIYEKFYSCYVHIAEGLDMGYEFTDKIFEAIEKQIPKKPIQNEDDVYQFYCPTCHSIIGVDGQMLYSDYCCDCGQKLDWSEEE